MNKAILLFTALFITVFQPCSNQDLQQKIKISKSAQEFNRKVDSLIIGRMNKYNIPGLAIGLVKNGTIIYTKGYGVRKIGNTDLVSDNSIFHTASVSKLFTAMAVMQLVDKNIITINDKLVDILPEINYKDERVKDITIKHLLNHTSGLPDIHNYQWKNNHQSKNSSHNYILGLKLEVKSAPSTQYLYSNLAYDILGYLIEKASGVSFEDYVQNNILIPSGMHDSDFRYFNISDTLKTSPHSKKWASGKIYSRKVYPYTREHSPSSTLNASAKDLSKWMLFFLRTINDKTSTSIYNKMIKPSFDAYPNIGLGFQLYDFEKHLAIGHFGGDIGFRSFLMMIPSENIGLVILGNCDYDEDYRQEIINPIAKLMLTKK